jgi:hypothetical protein
MRQIWTLFAVLIATDVLAQAAGRGGLFTLSLPVSRNRLVMTRAGTGLAEVAVLALVPSLVFPLLSPLVGQPYAIADAKTMSGEFAAAIGTAPFSLTRTGDAVVAAPLTGLAIGKELEGTWSGTLNVEGQALRLLLKMANQPDGRSTAAIVSLDQGNLEIPVAVRQSGTDVTVDVTVNGGVYTAALNAARTELAGTYNVQGLALPLTLHRGPSR